MEDILLSAPAPAAGNEDERFGAVQDAIIKMPTKKEIQYRITDAGCWECTSHSTSNGYPVHTVSRRLIYLHRETYEQIYGTIPHGMVVRHKCDNRLCINPHHLELGTVADNVNDRVLRGRSASGERNGSHKLTADQASEIKHNKTTATRFLAAKYGVSKATIREIRRGENWKHII